MENVYGAHAWTLPSEWLVWLATSPVRLAVYRLQSFHLAVRLTHILGSAVLFGGILVLDLRLLGVARQIALPGLTRLLLPVCHVAFAAAAASGMLLFLFDPIQVGSHSWFLPKLALLAVAMANASLFSLPRRFGLRAIGEGSLTRHARIAGAVSLVLWSGVMVAATANHEERPLRIPSRAASGAPSSAGNPG